MRHSMRFRGPLAVPDLYIMTTSLHGDVVRESLVCIFAYEYGSLWKQNKQRGSILSVADRYRFQGNELDTICFWCVRWQASIIKKH